MITGKDRERVIRMAGNIACGMCSLTHRTKEEIAEHSVKLAFMILAEVDRLKEESEN